MSAFDELERQLLDRVARRGTRSASDGGLQALAAARGRLRERRIRLAAIGVVLAVAAAVAVALVASAGRISIAAQAYAATNTQGRIVHFIEVGSGRTRTGIRFTRRAEVWLSGSRSRVREELRDVSAKGGVMTARHEVEADGSRVRNFEARPHEPGLMVLYRMPDSVHQRCQVFIGCGSLEEPIAIFRRLYREGRLSDNGQRTVRGRTLDLLTATGSKPVTHVLLDPKTGLPVEIEASYGHGAYATHTTLSGYERLALEPRTAGLLQLRPHPHARRVELRSLVKELVCEARARVGARAKPGAHSGKLRLLSSRPAGRSRRCSRSGG